MRILVIGDLHGQKPRIHFKDFDCIVQIGDVCSDKWFRPYIKKWFGLLKESSEKVPSMRQMILDDVGKEGLKKMEKKSLEEGHKILKYLNSFEKPVFFVPGNWDQCYGKTKIKDIDKNDYTYFKVFRDWWLGKKLNPLLIKDLKNVISCQYKLNKFNGINFLGYGLSSGPEDVRKPHRSISITKRQLLVLNKFYDKIKSLLSLEYKKRDKKFPTVFLTHNVPKDTKLDVVINKKSYANKRHLGSDVARDFCEKYQPLICVGGHVHEYFGKDKIGKTTVINAGHGRDANVLIDLDEKKGKIRKIEFYKGYKPHKN